MSDNASSNVKARVSNDDGERVRGVERK